MILQTEKLTKVFSGKWGKKVTALNDLNLAVEQGSVFGFIGPNGAGKSTTIKMLMGFIKPTSGSAKLCGLPVSDVSCRKNVGYLPENPKYHGYLTGKELLEMSAAIRGLPNKRIRQDVDELLHRVDLAGSCKRPIKTYSKGMVQRVGLANAMIGDPQILILDEPMSGLDPVGRNLVRNLMIDMKNEGKTIFFSSHILHDVETICDEVAIVLNGQLKYHGRLDRILMQTINLYDVRFFAALQKPIDDFLLSHEIKLVKQDDGTITAEVSKHDIDAVLKRLLAMNASLISLAPRHHSLEQYFMDLLKDS